MHVWLSTAHHSSWTCQKETCWLNSWASPFSVEALQKRWGLFSQYNVEFARVREASWLWSVLLNILEVRADSGFKMGSAKAIGFAHSYRQLGVLCTPSIAVQRVCLYRFQGTAKMCLYSAKLRCCVFVNFFHFRSVGGGVCESEWVVGMKGFWICYAPLLFLGAGVNWPLCLCVFLMGMPYT